MSESDQKAQVKLMLPPDFDSGKKYPLVVYAYGGPGYQAVNKKFDWNEKTIKKSELDINGQPQRLIGMVTRGHSRPFQYGRLNKQYVLALK